MIKKAIILTLILNSIIIIGSPAGHGGGPFLLIELMSLPGACTSVFRFNQYPFESLLMPLALLSLIGKLIIIPKLFRKDILVKRKSIRLGLTIILVSFLIICFSAGILNGDQVFMLILLTGIPFLISSISTFKIINKEIKKGQRTTSAITHG